MNCYNIDFYCLLFLLLLSIYICGRIIVFAIQTHTDEDFYPKKLNKIIPVIP